ncbi:MAG TPA: formyltransferase family protein [Thermoleophilaceae bacterium]
MRVVFMGKCKRSAARALEWLVEQGVEVVAVVAGPPDRFTVESQRLDLVAERHGLRLVTDDDLYAAIERGELAEVDLVLSFLFWKRIRQPLIELGTLGCLNFHPAPLPDYRGLGGFNVAILEGLPAWGVSCHFVDEQFDTGDLVEVDRFPIDREHETAFSLDLASQERLLAQFQRVLTTALAGAALPRSSQGAGRYVTRDDFERLRAVRPGDDVARAVRAFWYPPWPGAELDVDGRHVPIIDQALLEELAATLRAAGRVP